MMSIMLMSSCYVQDIRRVTREVLQKEADLSEIVQLVGKARS